MIEFAKYALAKLNPIINQMKEVKQVREEGPIRMYNVGEYYKIIDKVGRGTYGTVYKALGLKDNRFYAIKKLQNNDPKLQQEGFPITALREITLLKQIEHPNIIRLKEIILSRPNKRNFYRGSTFLVFEYMDHDFAGLFKMKCRFHLPEVKNIIRQLLEGVAYLHRNKIFHRDIKSANILLNDEGDVKLADFGLGRKIKFQNLFTYKVVTLWYRAPQLLLGCKTYSDKIDVWSIGCVVAQFFSGEILFKKQTEFAQMQRIYEICGDFQANQMKINQQPLKNCANINDFKPKKSYPKQLASHLRKTCPNITPSAVDFIERLLHLDPNRRMSCEEALRHHWFTEKPYACNKTEIQKMQYECHEMFRDNSIKIDRIVFKDEDKLLRKDDKHYREHPRRQIYNTRSSSEKDKHQKDDSISSQSKSSQYSSQRKNHDDKRHKHRSAHSPVFSDKKSRSRSRDRPHKNHHESRPFRNQYRDQGYRSRIPDERKDHKLNHREDKHLPKDEKDKYRRKDQFEQDKDYYRYDKTDKRYKDLKDNDRKEEKSEIRQDWRRESKDKKYDKFDKEKSYDKYDAKSSKFWSEKGEKDQYKRNDQPRDKNYQRDRPKERDREREKQKERERQRQRERDRQKEKEKERQKERQRERQRQRDRQRERQRQKQQERKRQKQRERQKERERQKWDDRPRYDRDKYQSRDKYDYNRKQPAYDKKPDKFVFVRERGIRKKDDRSSSSSKSYSSRSYKKDKDYRHNRHNYDRKDYKRGRSSSEGHHGERVYKS